MYLDWREVEKNLLEKAEPENSRQKGMKLADFNLQLFCFKVTVQAVAPLANTNMCCNFVTLYTTLDLDILKFDPTHVIRLAATHTQHSHTEQFILNMSAHFAVCQCKDLSSVKSFSLSL